jgi:hypothetical protein
MNSSKYLRRGLSLLAFLPVIMAGQRVQDVAPLKNWAAPLYWQPNQTEREASRQGAAHAQFQLSPNATSNTALVFVAISPCRMVDTRGAAAGFIGQSPFSGPFLQNQATVAFPVQSATEAATTAPTPCGTIPSIAQAYSLNLTVVPHPSNTPVTFVTIWPDNGSPMPTVSTLNDLQGDIVANSAIVPAGTNAGGIKVFAAGNTDIIIDLNGFYAAPTDLNSNTAIGAGTLSNNTTGNNNTAIGDQVLQNNTSGNANTGTGIDALQSNSTGGLNTASGFLALQNNTTGNLNTAFGAQALLGNGSGSNNTGVGQSTGGISHTGSFNTFIGSSAGTAFEPVTNATAIGANATVNESNALVLGGSVSGVPVNVGIGTPTPSRFYALDVEVTAVGNLNGGILANAAGGNIYLGMTNGTKKFRVDTNGTVFGDGGFQSSGADFAESVAVKGNKSLYEPGDLLVIDRGGRRSLTQSQAPYSTLVAGIYSTKPGVLATPHHIGESLDGEVPLAIVGIVPCKVTTENGAIREGDLLVTSSLPGYAMKGTDRRRLVGAVVGKALEPLPKGTGVIQVLVTLQ